MIRQTENLLMTIKGTFKKRWKIKIKANFSNKFDRNKMHKTCNNQHVELKTSEWKKCTC